MIKQVNKKLGLPFGKMMPITICIDVDGTLRSNKDKHKNKILANEDIRTLVRILSKFKNVSIIVWSGSGELYARQMGDKLHIDQYVVGYASKTAYKEIKPQIVIDDIQDTAIGLINLIVREK